MAEPLPFTPTDTYTFLIIKGTHVHPVSQIQDGLATAANVTASLVKVRKYLQLLARKDPAIATDNAVELAEINANGGSGAGAFSNQTDAVEAIRDRGDAAWTTGGGGGGGGNVTVEEFTAGALNQLMGRVITLRTPVAQGGHIDFVQGDAFDEADGTSLEFTNDAGDWPDLTGATAIWIEVESGPPGNPTGQAIGTGEVIVATGPGQKVAIGISGDETAGLKRGNGRYLVRVTLASGNTKTLVIGTSEVIKRIVTPET
jgi:hypothetical protein